jgi:hypothetical protein
MNRAELRALLGVELSARLEGAGWTVIDPEPTSEFFRLAEFDSRLGPEFSGVALVDGAIADRDAPPLVVNAVTVGVAYEPLRRLSPLLADGLRPAALVCLRSALLAYDVIRDLDEAGDVREEDDENTEEEETWQRPISTAAAAAVVAEELTGLILRRGVPCAQRLAHVDVLLAELEEDPGSIDWRVPALLAAARRFDEATEALAAFVELEASGRETRYAYQLRRWIESDGDPDLIPSQPQ